MKVGTKVIIAHTGDAGTVVKILDGGMVLVKTEDDIEIPVDKAFLETESKSSATAYVKPGIVKQKARQVAPAIMSVASGLGFLICFQNIEPDQNGNDRYKIWLINSTSRDLIYSISLSFKNITGKPDSGKISIGQLIDYGVMMKDNLNEAPVLDVEVWEIVTTGTGRRLSHSFKIKAKQFFKNIGTIPGIKEDGVIFKVFSESDFSNEKAKTESLKSYTKKHMVEPEPDSQIGMELYNMHNVEKLAGFKNEIDLHINKLIPDSSKMSKYEIVSTQLKAFNEFMDEAVNAGVDSVYIIHGVGKGSLRNIITEKLSSFHQVKYTEEGYHAGYGFGATKVFFR